MSLGSSARVMRDDDLSLVVTTSSGFTYGLIFRPARRACTVAGCTALIASDGTARAAGPGCCPDGQHKPSYPRYARHMMVVADLARGDAGAIEDAIEVAWQLQRRAG